MVLLFTFIVLSLQITSFHDYLLKSTKIPNDEAINKVYSDLLTSKFKNTHNIVNEMYSKALHNKMLLNKRPETSSSLLCDAETVKKMILLMNLDHVGLCDVKFSQFISALSKSINKICVHNTPAIQSVFSESLLGCNDKTFETISTRDIVPVETKTYVDTEYQIPPPIDRFEGPSCPTFRPTCGESSKMPLAKLLIKYDQKKGSNCPGGDCSLSIKTRSFINHEKEMFY
ncbi:hypothetical protein NGRA_1447 [Nosema granulosis]|uniref:Uncharacterized protein n=1 Tax=Nosema granulosis TaxID=83296 RepID=A0A9P6KZ58_9MICR|nr:hypothetical protein NGRA_1447 [Nosema granulosis]